MSLYLNKATIIGNIVRDPELKALPSGAKVVAYSIATNRKYKDKNGETKEQVEYHNIVTFGKMAELVAQYLKKGAQVMVEGRLQTRSWESDGKKMYRTEVVTEMVQFGNRPKQAEQKVDDDSAPLPEEQKEVNPDDIPF